MDETVERALLELEAIAKKLGNVPGDEYLDDAWMISNCVRILKEALERA